MSACPIGQVWESLLVDKLQVKKEVEVAKPERKDSISKESTDSKESDSKEPDAKDPKTTDEVEDAKDSGMHDHMSGCVHAGVKHEFDKAPKEQHTLTCKTWTFLRFRCPRQRS